MCNFATIADQLARLIKKTTPFRWSEEAEEAFQRLKQALLDATILTFPTAGVLCIQDTDASDVAIVAVLSQVSDGVESPAL